MIMKTEIKCSKAGCDYDLGEHDLNSDNFAQLVSLLQVHVNAAHSTGPVQQDGTSNSKPEKAKRPEMSAEMSEEDWEYFLSRWEHYKIATKLTGGEAVVIQLMECAVEQLRRDQYRTYGKGDGTATEQDILVQFKALAVQKKNNTVNRHKLSTMKQEKGEPVRKFFGRLRGVASVCGYTVSCNNVCCNGHQVPYYTQVIKEQLIKGLVSEEIQREVMSHKTIDTMDVDQLIVYIEGKEAGQTSQLLLGRVSASEAREKVCKFCGKSHKWGRRFCKANGHTCQKCKKADHFEAYCPAKETAKADTAVPIEEADQATSSSFPYGGHSGSWDSFIC